MLNSIKMTEHIMFYTHFSEKMTCDEQRWFVQKNQKNMHTRTLWLMRAQFKKSVKKSEFLIS